MSDLQHRYTELQSAGRVPRYLELPGMRHMFEGVGTRWASERWWG
jgi:hypothetical protein